MMASLPNLDEARATPLPAQPLSTEPAVHWLRVLCRPIDSGYYPWYNHSMQKRTIRDAPTGYRLRPSTKIALERLRKKRKATADEIFCYLLAVEKQSKGAS